jgi:membrane protease YdiL (CAAX protease family)
LIIEIKEEKLKKTGKSIFTETISIIGLIIILSFVFKQIAGLFNIIAIVYLFIERRKRGRTWEDIGFKSKSIMTDIKNNWHWIITVGVIIQFSVITIAKYFIPGYFEHVQARIPLMNLSQMVPLLTMIFIGTFAEEIVYRGFFQERISWFIKPAYAIVFVSIVFGIVHYSSDTIPIVVYDIGTIFIDSIIYGIIYNRTKNIYVSWIAHLLADLVGIVLLLFYI